MDSAHRQPARSADDRWIDAPGRVRTHLPSDPRTGDRNGSDFYVDLLFFHVDQLRYVVVELKTGEFRPDNIGQLSFSVALVDDRLRRDAHAATVGLLLVAGKNDAIVRYSLGTSSVPVGVSSYELLPAEIQRALPSEAQLRRALRPGDGGQA